MDPDQDPRYAALLHAARAWRDLINPNTEAGRLSLDPAVTELLDAVGGLDPDPDDAYRIALRTYDDHGGPAHGPPWPGEFEGTSPPLDDIVVNGVSCFRMEDMGERFWMACWLEGHDDQIVFDVRRGFDGEPPIVVTAVDMPDVVYEQRRGT